MTRNEDPNGIPMAGAAYSAGGLWLSQCRSQCAIGQILAVWDPLKLLPNGFGKRCTVWHNRYCKGFSLSIEIFQQLSLCQS